MKRILQRLEEQIEELKQDETRVMRTCDFLSEDTLKARKELLRKLETRRDKLLHGATEVCCIPNEQTPSRVELMDAWSHLFFGMLIATWACLSIAYRHQGAPTVICTLGVWGMVIASGLLGLAAMALFTIFGGILSKCHPLYMAPRTLMNCRYKELKARLSHLSKPAECAKDISFFLCAMIMLGNIATFIHPDFSWLSILFGFILSVGGFLVFAVILLTDLATVFFRKCKLWFIGIYSLYQVF